METLPETLGASVMKGRDEVGWDPFLLADRRSHDHPVQTTGRVGCQHFLGFKSHIYNSLLSIL